MSASNDTSYEVSGCERDTCGVRFTVAFGKCDSSAYTVFYEESACSTLKRTQRLVDVESGKARDLILVWKCNFFANENYTCEALFYYTSHCNKVFVSISNTVVSICTNPLFFEVVLIIQNYKGILLSTHWKRLTAVAGNLRRGLDIAADDWHFLGTKFKTGSAFWSLPR